jgi:hypothetical protein
MPFTLPWKAGAEPPLGGGTARAPAAAPLSGPSVPIFDHDNLALGCCDRASVGRCREPTLFALAAERDDK